MRLGRVLAGLALVATIAVGCSSGDGKGSASSSTSTTTSEPTTTTSNPMLVGTLEPQHFEGTASSATHLLRAVVTHEAGIDRVAFQFDGDGLPTVDASYVEHPTQDGSGAPVDVQGTAFLSIRFEPSTAIEMDGETAKRTDGGNDHVTGTSNDVLEVVHSGDFEAVLSWVIGLRKKDVYSVRTLPAEKLVVVLIETR